MDVFMPTPTPAQDMPSPMPTQAPAEYVLECIGCEWEHKDPHNFAIAKVLAHAHQLKVAWNMKHGVLFTPVGGK